MSSDLPIQKHEVLIDGMLYDCSKFKHPGGSIIKFNMGEGDATLAFLEFHDRSEKAKKMLKSLPSRPAPKGTSDESKRNEKFTAAYKKLREELVREGWFKPSLLHVAYRIAEVVALYVVGLYLMLNTSFFLVGVALAAIAQGRCGWLMHEGGHISLTGNWKLDIRLQEVIYGIGCGMSGGWWRVQHNKHHAEPQKLTHDVDLDTLPLVAFHSKVAQWGKKNPFIRMWIPFQAYCFGPVTTSLVAAFWQFFLHPRFIIRTKKYNEAAMLATRYAIIAALAVYANATLAQTIGTYFLYNAIAGAYIFINFALSHTHLPVVNENEHRHWMEYGANHTINITPHPFTNWWMGYLNYQIEHHLFPSMPQYRFVKLWPRTKKLFEENGLKYDARDYFIAMKDTFRNLDVVGSSLK